MSKVTYSTPSATNVSHRRIAVERWPSEMPLFVVAAVFGALVWLVAAIKILPLMFAAVLGLLFYAVHAAFVAHVRGNGVRLGPHQFPALYAKVEDLAQRMELPRVPETYIMQEGGVVNAFATRFLGSNVMVLFSDLLEECGDNTAARDMIIGHELGHIKAGHLRLRWLLLPAAVIPFLTSALSRAREYTCDRYGLAAAEDLDGALMGLTVLASGGKLAKDVNRAVFVSQREELLGFWMELGEWLSTHPPLCKRIAALDPSL